MEKNFSPENNSKKSKEIDSNSGRKKYEGIPDATLRQMLRINEGKVPPKQLDKVLDTYGYPGEIARTPEQQAELSAAIREVLAEREEERSKNRDKDLPKAA